MRVSCVSICTGPEYCNLCAGVFRAHIIKSEVRPDTCSRERPCHCCGQILAHVPKAPQETKTSVATVQNRSGNECVGTAICPICTKAQPQGRKLHVHWKKYGYAGPRTAPLVLPLSETMSSASDPAERAQQVGLDANALFAPTFWSIVPVRPHEYHRRQKPPHWERRHPHTTEAPGLLRLLLPGMAANHRYMTYMLRCHRPTGSLMSL